MIGVVPYLSVDIEEEDSLASCLTRKEGKKPLDVAVIRLPKISNFTDFAPLDAHPLLGVRYVRQPMELGEPDILFLPGTKSTMADLLWMRQNAFEAAILKLAAKGTPIFGICGGYQMLGQWLSDPAGVEDGGELRGMGLLPTHTVFQRQKTRTQTDGTVQAEPFQGAKLRGYEIHNGKTTGAATPFCIMENGAEDGCVSGTVFGTYLHGLFDSGELTERLAAWLCQRKGIAYETAAPMEYDAYREQQFDKLAAGVRENLDMAAVYGCMGMVREAWKED